MSRLNSQERRLLLTTARRAVRACLTQIPADRASVPQGLLQESSGVFVSIHRGDQLRGCIGRIESAETLLQTTADCAVSAAVADPRFSPVALSELDEVCFEISVLSEPWPISGSDQVEVGRHGLMVEMGERRGLLLPQVASEYDWSGEEFLRQTCLKAGVPKGMNCPGLRVFAFEAQVFAEDHRI